MGLESATINNEQDVRQRAVPRMAEEVKPYVPGPRQAVADIPRNESIDYEKEFERGFNNGIRCAIIQAQKFNGPTSSLVMLLKSLLSRES